MSDTEEPPCLLPISGEDAPKDVGRECSTIEGRSIEEVSAPPYKRTNVQDPVPVLLLTGYLGSGKTTLINYILTKQHGYRCAVLLNEIGDTADIERALVKEPEGQEASPLTDWVELENGCICCSVKNEMVKSLEMLLQQRTKFDYIIIETTGLANPGPVAAALWTDAELESSLCLDAIVTVVDAVNIMKHMKEFNTEDPKEANEAQRQLAFADVILLNKIDLVGDAEVLASIETEIRRINTNAKILHCTRCEIPLHEILNTGIYTGEKVDLSQEYVPAVHQDLQASREHCSDEPCSQGTCSHKNHHHQTDVRTYTYLTEAPLDLEKFRHWLDEFLWEDTKDEREVYRVKGLLQVNGSDTKCILQAVHEIYDILEGVKWQQDEKRGSKLVFIGRNLDHGKIANSIKECQVAYHAKE